MKRIAAGTLLVFVVAAAPLLAKGPTVLLTITGKTLSHPVEVTDAGVLDGSNVYAGAFLGATCAEPDRSWPRYQVRFHVELPAWMRAGVQVKYVVTYTKDPVTGRGFVYLPDRGDEGYGLNAGTILRETEGKWHSASIGWAAGLNQHLR